MNSDEVLKSAAEKGSIPHVTSENALTSDDEESKRKLDLWLSNASNNSTEPITYRPTQTSAEEHKAMVTTVGTEIKAHSFSEKRNEMLPPPAVPSRPGTSPPKTTIQPIPNRSVDNSVLSVQDFRVSAEGEDTTILETEKLINTENSSAFSIRTDLKAAPGGSIISNGDDCPDPTVAPYQQSNYLKSPAPRNRVSWIDQREISPGGIPTSVFPPGPKNQSFSETSGISFDRKIPPEQPQSTNSSIDVKLKQVIKRNPLETEAETLILRALDQQDAINLDGNDSIYSNGSRNRASNVTSLLGRIPDEASTVFAPEPDRVRASTHRSTRVQASPPETTNNADTVRVSETTREILATFAQKQMNAFDTKPHTIKPESRVTSSGETLAQNADLLFLVKQKSQRTNSYDTNAQENPTAPERDTTPGSKWELLKSALRATSHFSHSNDGVPQPSGRTSLHSNTKTVNDTPHLENIQEDEEVGLSIQSDTSAILISGHNNNENGNSTRTFGHDKIDEKTKLNKKRRVFASKGAQKKGYFLDFQLFIAARRRSLITYVRLLLLVVLPASMVACILFYLAGNPPTGRVDPTQSGNNRLVNQNGELIDPSQASASWWILFICVRQAVTFSLAHLLQTFIVDFLCLGTRMVVNVFGNLFTLFIVQSRGWPFIIFMWGLLDFGLLHGGSVFAGHWCYWQDWADVFNDNNPSGYVTKNIWNTRALSIAVAVGAVATFKRLWLGFYLGKKTYANFADDLSKVVRKIVILSDIASLSREFLLDSFIEEDPTPVPLVSEFGISEEEFEGLVQSGVDSDEGSTNARRSLGSKSANASYHGGNIVETINTDGIINQSNRSIIAELLGDWEDPEDYVIAQEEISITCILQFRQSLSVLGSRFMFGTAWGDVGSREKMVVSSQEVYQRLMLKSPDKNILKFDVIALAAKRDDGSLDQDRLKQIIRLLRPHRDGTLSLLDSVKSVDAVYKEAKLLRASVENSEKIDRALEQILNVAFYTIIIFIILSQIGIDPLMLFLSLSSLIVGFAFMIGRASSRIFEGILFILLRRPYGIGDRIHVSNPESNTSPDGSSGWIVMDVTLFHTIAIFATTNEKATLSNGSLANSRVFNMARSPHAIIYIYLKFSVDVAYEKVQVFEQSLRDFTKARPREWASFEAFNLLRIEADLGYIEYVVILEHRDSWQQVPSILKNKAEVSSFCLELSKQLGMRYHSPALPVDLRLSKPDDHIVTTSGEFRDSGMSEGSVLGDTAFFV